MKSKLVAALLLFVLTNTSFSQQETDRWGRLNYLVGNWKGEGSGKPGEGEGVFTFKFDLDKNILVRTSRSDYPATQDKPAINHTDLMIIYRDYAGIPGRAIYFDNENHVINYSITFPTNKDIVFTSDKIPGIPRFRLTYTVLETDSVNVKFEMSQDGEKYFTYVEGKSTRIK